MKTLYEEIMKNDYSDAPDEQKKIIGIMDQAEIFHIQNVADYWFNNHAGNNNGKDYYELFPNVAPPFPAMFFEYSLPPKIFLDGILSDNPNSGMKYGFLICSSQKDSGDIKWRMEIMVFGKPPNNEIKFYGKWKIYIAPDGQITQTSGHQDVFHSGVYNIEPTRGMENYDFAVLGCNLLALSFLHCKNVELIPHDPKTPGKRAKRNQSRITYHTLQIEPMKKILKEEGQSETTGIKHALHICRGHFKDFSKGKGLFGKYQGLYWWDSQVRGNAKHGIVNKDYEIDKPAA